MIVYPHFAIPNLYLVNGYKEAETEHGIEHQYEFEDELERCVQCLLLRKPSRLRGWDLRYLRRSLDLSQTDFGRLVDRDPQTVARWEKSVDEVPQFIDLTIRMRFAERFVRDLSAVEVLSYVDGTARKLPEKILLHRDATGWKYSLEPTFKLRPINTRSVSAEVWSPSRVPILKIFDRFMKDSSKMQFGIYAEIDDLHGLGMWTNGTGTSTQSASINQGADMGYEPNRAFVDAKMLGSRLVTEQVNATLASHKSQERLQLEVETSSDFSIGLNDPTNPTELHINIQYKVILRTATKDVLVEYEVEHSGTFGISAWTGFTDWTTLETIMVEPSLAIMHQIALRRAEATIIEMGIRGVKLPIPMSFNATERLEPQIEQTTEIL